MKKNCHFAFLVLLMSCVFSASVFAQELPSEDPTSPKETTNERSPAKSAAEITGEDAKDKAEGDSKGGTEDPFGAWDTLSSEESWDTYAPEEPEEERLDERLPERARTQQRRDNRAGLGISIESENSATLRLPVDIGGARFEPELSFAYENISGLSEERSESSSSLDIGAKLGLYSTRELTTDTLLYSGGRLGLSWKRSALEIRSLTDGGTPYKEEINGIGVHISAVMGAEYALSPHFSIGAETALAISFYPEAGIEPRPSTRLAIASLNIGLKNALVIRWFY